MMKRKSEEIWAGALRGSALAAILALGVVGCGQNNASDSKPEEKAPAAAAPEADDHHAEGEGHEDAEGGHEHGDEKHDLGKQTIGAWGVSVTQMDNVAAGGETVFYVSLDGPADPPHIRIWVGDATASNSVKEVGEVASERRYHAHVQIPEGYGEMDKFWVELEGADGAVQTGSFEIAK